MGKDLNLERSRLVSKHVQIVRELEKDVKKKKGGLKEAAQAKLEAAFLENEEELAAFDAQAKVSSSAADRTDRHQNASGTSAFRNQNWEGLSKKELIEACTERGLGKKGTKEDMVSKLIAFHQSLPSPPTPPPQEKEDDVTAEDERKYKRELIMRKALVKILEKESETDAFDVGVGIASKDIPPKLHDLGVRNFRPSLLGYRSVHAWLKRTPKTIIHYDANTRKVFPPNQTSEVEDEDDSSDGPSDSEDSSGDDDDPRAIRPTTTESQPPTAVDERPSCSSGENTRHKNKEDGSPPSTSTIPGTEEDERHHKRELLMRKVLKRIICDKPEGIKVEDLETEFQRLNVTNFSPTLMGYSCVDEWLSNQPTVLLKFDKTSQTIFPPDDELSEETSDDSDVPSEDERLNQANRQKPSVANQGIKCTQRDVLTRRRDAMAAALLYVLHSQNQTPSTTDETDASTNCRPSLLVEDLPEHFQHVNVRNYDPCLLGFESSVEWLQHLCKHFDCLKMTDENTKIVLIQ
eukprot:Filipodium_phascolosomae@DN6884_c0_g1_i1.p1